MGKWEYTKRHLVRVSLHHAGAHVLNVRADRANASKLLALAEPQINLHVTLLGLRDIEVDVLELTDKRATLARDGDHAHIAS